MPNAKPACAPTPGPHAWEAAARAFLAREQARLPDLRTCTLLVPHFHAATPWLTALRGQVRQAVFLPPRILTLPALAASVPDSELAEPDALRIAQVQTFLARSGLLPQAALWPAAQQLVALLDELSSQLLTPPSSFEAFRHQCEAAYKRRLGQPLEREARLVFELWHAMAQGERPDRMAVYARRLAWAAEHAPGPLYYLGLGGAGDLSRLEARFLEQWATRHPVHVLPALAALPGRAELTESAWAGPARESSLPERAASLRTAAPASAWAGQVRLLPAHGLEAEARGAAQAIHDWIAQGLERIGIVALDRMTARRLRALLEHAQVLIQDETGWTFSTAAVSHVLDRLCALAADDCYYLDLLDLLKSPFVFSDMSQSERLAAVAELEAAIRANRAVQGLTNFSRLAQQAALPAVPMLGRLATALHALGARRDSLAGWLARLLQALDALGATPALQADTAGTQLLYLLRRLAADIAPHDARHSFAQWRGWLLQQLETATFMDTGIDSPLRLTHLAGARWRDFEAVLLLGADATHLPARASPGVFNDALRAELGLPGQRQGQAEQRAHLGAILEQTPQVLITWQASQDGDPNPPSPWLELLDALHRLAYGDSLRMAAAPDTVPGRNESAAPHPCPSLRRLPSRLSASAWQSLVVCPYQYFARHGLGLREQEDVPEEVEKRDYGERVHAILHAFHRDHPRLAEHPRKTLIDALETLSQRHFGPLLETHYLALAWLARWQRQIHAYVDWALAREGAGYRWRAAEVDQRRELNLVDGMTLTLHGRLDRLDGKDGDIAVLDYKTQSKPVLARKLKQPGEDVQLPFYAMLVDAAEAAFVALDDAHLTDLPWPGDLEEAVDLERQRLRRTWQALARGAGLPAQGADQTCAWCEMRGLCRKDYWPDAPASPAKG